MQVLIGSQFRYGIRLIILALIFIAITPYTIYANEELKLYEQEIKAGLLYNFLKYTNWPDTEKPASKIELCIFGNDPFNGYLKPMSGKSVNQRTIMISNVYSIDELKKCHMLFVASEEQKQWPALRSYLSDKNILTVSDIKGFTANGGMIEFSHKNQRINVMLNQNALNSTKLSVQDRLMKLVTITGTGR